MDKETCRKRKEIQKLCLMDDLFMSKVFENNIPCTELLLHIILKNDKLKVKYVHPQHSIKNLQGHSIQLDILAQDEHGSFFNVEVQRLDKWAISKRARYYSSILDANILNPGEDYSKLPETYVVFITEHDILGEGRPLYNIERTIQESGKLFGDEAHIVYVNASKQDETPLGMLMRDFFCQKPEEMHYKELAERTWYLKYDEEGLKEMESVTEKIFNRGLVEGETKTQKNNAMKMLKKGYPEQEIMDITGITPALLQECKAAITSATV